MSVLLTLFVAAAINATEWREYTSKNYVVYSDMEPARIRKAIADFEVHRYIVLMFLNAPAAEADEPLRIIALDRSGDYRRLTGSTGIGYYWSTYDGPHAVLTRRRLRYFLELNVRYLVREVARLEYPRWYEDGLAQVLAETRFDGGTVTLGVRPEWRHYPLFIDDVVNLDLLLDKYDELRPREEDSRFLNASWLMVHLLQIRTFEQGGELRRETQEYLRRYAAGQDTRSAFDDSFESPISELNNELRRYGRSQNLPAVEIPTPVIDTSTTSRLMTDAERTHLLGDLALDLQGADAALGYLEDIPVEHYDDRTASLRALVDAYRGEFDAAAAHAARVEEYVDAVTLRHLGYAEWVRYSASQGDIADEARDRAMSFAEEALKVDPDDVDSHLLQWRIHDSRGDDVAAAKSMMEGYRRNETNTGLNVRIAQYLIENGKADLARPFLDRVFAWSYSKDQRRWAADQLRELEERNAE